jgi:hypothetical protein
MNKSIYLTQSNGQDKRKVRQGHTAQKLVPLENIISLYDIPLKNIVLSREL